MDTATYPEASRKITRKQPLPIPKKLATTMGIELTYLPSFYETIYESSGLEFAKLQYGELDNNLRNELATKLRKALDKAHVSYYRCATDPLVVEVPTKPHDEPRALLDCIMSITEQAESVGLTPRVSYCEAGGGAHIHTGIPECIAEAGKGDVYVRLLHIYAADNPWLCWAFAAYDDQQNAQPFARRNIYRQVVADTKSRIKMQINEQYAAIQGARALIKNAQGEMDMARKRLIVLETQLHTREVYRNVGRVHSTTMMINDCQSNLRRFRKYILRKRDVMAEVLERIAVLSRAMRKQTAAPRLMVTLRSINPWQMKDHVMVWRSGLGTVEWRAFRMSWDMRDQRKHIVLLHKIIEQVTAQALTLTMDDLVPESGYTMEQLCAMPYSQRAAGFNRMLDELGLDREHYKQERVNMALRMRHIRKNKMEGVA